MDPHFGKIVHDEGNLLADWDKDNTHAKRYIDRVTNKENLEASNQLFIELVEAIHKRGMKVSWTVYLTIVDPLTNGWTGNGSMKISRATKRAHLQWRQPVSQLF